MQPLIFTRMKYALTEYIGKLCGQKHEYKVNFAQTRVVYGMIFTDMEVYAFLEGFVVCVP